ncbi:terpenoid synthase [Sparassis latifolia]|uniref:Terpene synthase n=1 Tax=Sparassis crispa TaxID=139825 RepID=A0A401GFX2_9APHY|nr:Delta(6)-protoilludene synthase [Sparassis crispa]GBE81078.1 Delta(6)-protoilludene synthase [Sparassis crispa]
MSAQFRLPDTLATWPWPREINPYYDEVMAESSEWFRSFHAFSEKAQRAFDLCDFSRLASLAYPALTREQLRTGCDLMNVFFVFDEYTDNEPVDVVKQIAEISMDALRNPHKARPAGENVVGEITRQYWERGILTATPTAQRRFIGTWERFTASVIRQAEDRSQNHIRTIPEYLALRRYTIGGEPSYAMLELGLNIPDEAFYHPTMVELTWVVTDMIIVGNDIFSYNKEQAAGDDMHNIVTIAMNDLQTDIYGAMEWIDGFHRELVERFFDLWAKLQELSWGPEVDQEVPEYARGLAGWVRANDCWSFESGRYFGTKGLDIQKHRMVTLLPKSKGAEDTV